MKNKIIKVKYLFLLFIDLFLINYSSSYIVIPFKINNKESEFKYNDFLDKKTGNSLYTYLSIGNAGKKILAFITSETHQIEFDFNSDVFDMFVSDYSTKNSDSYKVLNNDEDKRKFFTESVTFYKNINFKESITVNNLIFEYMQDNFNKLNETYECINIGIKLKENTNNNNNIILQLKKKNIINNYNFNFVYEDFVLNDITYNGYFVIGAEPHEYLPKKYKEEQLMKTTGEKRDFEISWDIHFDKIFFSSIDKNLNKEEIIIDYQSPLYSQATINPGFGLYIGSLEYRLKVQNEFSKGILSKRYFSTSLGKSKYTFYYCKYEKGIEEDLKQFPSLYLQNNLFNNAFELNYNDLFSITKDYVFFNVVFEENEQTTEENDFVFTSRWSLGSPFLKKYMLTFNYDSKTIGFYNENLYNGNYKENTVSKSKIFILVILGLLIAFICFRISKNIFTKNKKITANELEYNNFHYEKSVKKKNNENGSLGFNI